MSSSDRSFWSFWTASASTRAKRAMRVAHASQRLTWMRCARIIRIRGFIHVRCRCRFAGRTNGQFRSGPYDSRRRQDRLSGFDTDPQRYRRRGFQHNPALLEALRKTKAANNRSISWGCWAMAECIAISATWRRSSKWRAANRSAEVYLHLFLDGRDTPPTSAEQFMLDLNEKLKAYPNVKIATVSGRYYAMDRDQRWDRVEKAYVCLTEGIGKKAASALAAIRDSYKEKINDEFVLPTTINGVVPEGLDAGRRRRDFFQLSRRPGARADPGADRRGFQGIFAASAASSSRHIQP